MSVKSLSSVSAAEAAGLPVVEVVNNLRADPSNGLSSREADGRRQIHGLNDFVIKGDDPLWKKYINQVHKLSYCSSHFGSVHPYLV